MTISIEDKTKAEEWLADNTDKWENFIDWEWLIPNPEEVVPPYVFKYVEFIKAADEEGDKFFEMYNAMGLSDDF